MSETPQKGTLKGLLDKAVSAVEHGQYEVQGAVHKEITNVEAKAAQALLHGAQEVEASPFANKHLPGLVNKAEKMTTLNANLQHDVHANMQQLMQTFAASLPRRGDDVLHPNVGNPTPTQSHTHT